MLTQHRNHLLGRRSRRKSKNGCSGCKRRHIKCDETRPECRNCVMGERLCSYLTPGHSREGIPPRSAYIAPPPSSVICDHGLVIHRDTREGPPCAWPTFTATHIAFFHYAESNMSEYMALQGRIRPMIDTAVEHSLTAPYLLDQLLALSSLHLSTRDVAQANLFRHHATELQTRALGLFNQAKDHISDNTFMPTFLFASLLGLHVLHDTLQRPHGTLAEFIEAFVSYLRLHRGVRAIIEKYWHRILQSDLKPLLYITVLSEQADPQVPGEETRQLREFLKSSSTLSITTKACISALSRVQWVLETIKKEPSRFDVGAHAVMAWPLVIPDEYIEALHQHRPEALVVLAFYAATLHRHRKYWVFGDSGSSLIRLVSKAVGSFWQDVLAWPFQVLEEDQPLTT